MNIKKIALAVLSLNLLGIEAQSADLLKVIQAQSVLSPGIMKQAQKYASAQKIQTQELRENKLIETIFDLENGLIREYYTGRCDTVTGEVMTQLNTIFQNANQACAKLATAISTAANNASFIKEEEILQIGQDTTEKGLLVEIIKGIIKENFATGLKIASGNGLTRKGQYLVLQQTIQSLASETTDETEMINRLKAHANLINYKKAINLRLGKEEEQKKFIVDGIAQYKINKPDTNTVNAPQQVDTKNVNAFNVE